MKIGSKNATNVSGMTIELHFGYTQARRLMNVALSRGVSPIFYLEELITTELTVCEESSYEYMRSTAMKPSRKKSSKED